MLAEDCVEVFLRNLFCLYLHRFPDKKGTQEGHKRDINGIPLHPSPQRHHQSGRRRRDGRARDFCGCGARRRGADGLHRMAGPEPRHPGGRYDSFQFHSPDCSEPVRPAAEPFCRQSLRLLPTYDKTSFIIRMRMYKGLLTIYFPASKAVQTTLRIWYAVANPAIVPRGKRI